MKSLSPLPILNPAAPPPQTLGVERRPPACKLLCPYYTVGSGYSHDWLPETGALVLFMIASPSADDLLNRRHLSGKAGWSFFKQYIEPLKFTQDDYGVCSVLRCRPCGSGEKGAKGGQFPTGAAKTGAVQACRYYDREIIAKFNPDLYILTQSLKSTYEEAAFTRLLQRDISKAFTFAQKGYRPIVLMGNEAAEMVAPYIVGHGGVKSWRGHFQEMPEGWPFLSAETPQKPKVGFTPARY